MLPFLLLLTACTEPVGDTGAPTGLCTWVDHPDDPLIEPPGAETLVGDPAVVAPEEAPDGQWHLFAQSMLGIHHWVSADGVVWELATTGVVGVGAWRPEVVADGGLWHLLYDQYTSIDSSVIEHRTSEDLWEWSEAEVLLEPTQAWEQEGTSTVGNPALVRDSSGGWRLYYSAGGALLEDVDFYEPRYVGMATGPGPGGPWEKQVDPVLAPEEDDPWRNLGAGSIEVLEERWEGRWLALSNGIYTHEGASGSAIQVLTSEDGVAWQAECGGEPVLAPEGRGWKAAFVYGLEPLRRGEELWAFYNARDGWVGGVERIGLARAQVPAGG